MTFYSLCGSESPKVFRRQYHSCNFTKMDLENNTGLPYNNVVRNIFTYHFHYNKMF